MTLTYLQFHLVFLVPALVVLAVLVRRYGDGTVLTPGQRRLGVGILAVVAVVYTTPWDNYLITRGVWWYGDGRVIGTLWHAPVEEYLFMLLQPVVTGLWLSLVPSAGAVLPDAVSRRARVAGAAAGLVPCVLGLALLAHAPTFYLGAILAWAGPVLALQWGFGWPVLWALRRHVAVGAAVPTAYFWVADRIAIGLEVWTISERHTTGLLLAGLPVEEALFFLVTNLFVVQGLVLFAWVLRDGAPSALPATLREWVDGTTGGSRSSPRGSRTRPTTPARAVRRDDGASTRKRTRTRPERDRS